MGVKKSPALTVDAIVYREDKILMVKRKNPPFEGAWALPGGFVEYGEPVEQALARELKEETGLEAQGPKLFNVYSDPGRDPRGHVVSLCFVADASGEPKAGDDAKEARFLSSEELIGREIAFDHKDILREYMERGHVL